MLFNTDKVLPHGYFQAYVQIAGELGPAADVCELGVAEGESLKMWQALFPLGTVTGVDSSSAAVWPEGTVRVLADHNDPDLPSLVGGPFGLIVDDGCHIGAVAERSFDLLWPLVQPGGYYAIEDWAVSIDEPAHYGDGMLRLGEKLFQLTYPRGNPDCDFVTYRYGMIIIHRRAAN
jgi:Methyltransferase domain